MIQSELQIFAVIADCYTPILLLIALFEVRRSWFRCNKLHAAQLLYVAFVVYSLMFIDKYFQLWAMIGLDYSTHSAAAFALVVVIGLSKRLLSKLALALSLAAYGGLMDMLNYHNWGDMLTTMFIIAILLFPILKLRKNSGAVT